MGWGPFLAGLAVKGFEHSVESHRKNVAERETRERFAKMQEENRQNRSLKVEESLVLSDKSLYQLTGEKRLLLEGESTPIARQLVLPGPVQRNYYNTVISGGENSIRAVALLKTCEDAYENGFPTIIIHCANHAIETLIANSNAIRNKLIINSGNGLYNPFPSLSVTDISNLFIKSATGNAYQNWSFQSLVALIAELYQIRQKKSIPLRVLLKTKVADLPAKIQDTRANGLIDDRKMIELNQQYQSSQTDAHSFQQYLNQLQSRFDKFYSKNCGDYKGLGKALHGNTVVTLDITDTSNGEFVRFAINNLILLRAKGVDFITCFVDLNLSAYDGVMYDFAVDSNTKFSLCSPDIITCIGSTDKANTLMGLVRNRAYFNHVDGNHCNILSDGLGTYRRWNISYTHSNTNRGLVPDVSIGENISVNPSEKRIPPEILLSLSGDQMVFKDGGSNDIFLMRLC
jgi:hypothetical protein